MKSEFSTAWQSSKQPRKQRKFVYNAPLHTKHVFLSANLAKDLRKKYAKKSFPVRKGDEVVVMRGSFKKKKAKVTQVDLKNTRVSLENIQRTKKDGTKVSVWFHPSVLQIHTLNLEDRKRIDALERKNKKPENKKTQEKKNAPNKSNSK